MKIHSLTEKIAFFEKCFGPGQLSRDNINFTVRCPICDPIDRTKKKLAIRTDNDKNHCWVCGWQARSLVSLLRKCGTQDQLIKYQQEFLAIDEATRKKLLITPLNVEKPVLKLPDDFRPLVYSSNDPDQLACIRYVTSRGLTERDLWYFKIGYSNEFLWHRRVIVPSFDINGNLNFFVGRAIDKKRKPKYEASVVVKEEFVFNDYYIDWSKELCICEGPFDMMKCPQNTVPFLGSDLNENSLLFEKIIVNKTKIVLLLDQDMMETKFFKIMKKFAEYDVSVKYVDLRDYGKSDPGEMTKSEVLQAISEAKYFTWENKLKSKLLKASRSLLKI